MFISVALVSCLEMDGNEWEARWFYGNIILEEAGNMSATVYFGWQCSSRRFPHSLVMCLTERITNFTVAVMKGTKYWHIILHLVVHRGRRRSYACARVFFAVLKGQFQLWTHKLSLPTIERYRPDTDRPVWGLESFIGVLAKAVMKGWS